MSIPVVPRIARIATKVVVRAGLKQQMPQLLIDACSAAGIGVTTPLAPEPESAEYGAWRVGIAGHNVVVRSARTTPTKIGQFVTLWKRMEKDIAPLDSADDVQFAAIHVGDGKQEGWFIVDRAALLAHGVMSRDGAGGKRALRVYPPWCAPVARQAVRSQQWQLNYFVAAGADDAQRARRLLALFGKTSATS